MTVAGFAPSNKVKNPCHHSLELAGKLKSFINLLI
jgi:hypothetical protein